MSGSILFNPEGYIPSYNTYDLRVIGTDKNIELPDRFSYVNALFIDSSSGRRLDRDFFESSDWGNYHLGFSLSLTREPVSDQPLMISLNVSDLRTTEEISQITEYKVLPSGR
jgi:hypothetical protein